MRTLAQFVFIALCFCATAQSSNLIVFSEDGDSFTLFVNGARQNAAPQTRVKVTDITGDGCKVKVVFRDVSLPEFSKYVIVESGQEVTFGIKKNKKGAFVLRLVSTSEKNNEPADPAFGKLNNEKNQNLASTTNNSTTVTTSSSTQTSRNVNSENVSMNVSMAGDEPTGSMNVSVNASDQSGNNSGKSQGNSNHKGENLSMNVSVNGDEANASMNVSMNASQRKNQGNSKSNNGNRNGQQKNENNGNHYGQYKNKPGFCSGKGLTGQDMVKIKYDIQQKYLDAARGDMIKKIAVDNCVHSSQAAEMIKLLSLDRTRYEVGMFVFQHIYDPSEYYLVVDLIGDISLKQKLEDYVLDYLKSPDTPASGGSSGNAKTASSSSSTSQSSSNSTPAPANGNIVININNAPVNTNEIKTTSTTTTSRTTTTSNTEGSCSLSDSQYDDIVSSISSKPHSDTKMTIAKQALKNRCVTVRQVIGFAKLFVHEADKLEFAKFAYKYTSNKSDYYKVADVFSNSFTIDELNDFLDSN